jgi:type IV secretory pathway VirJ component
MTRRAALLCSLLILAAFSGFQAGAAPKKKPAKAPGPKAAQAVPAPPGSTIMQFAELGPVPVFRPAGAPSQVAILLSGDQGIGTRETEVAHALAATGSLVFALDVPRYAASAIQGKDKCLYPATELHQLGQNGEARSDLPTYHPPLLVGVGSGGTFAYATLAQSAPGTWAGAVSLGYNPVFTGGELCRAGGLRWEPVKPGSGVRLLPDRNLKEPWIVLDAAAWKSQLPPALAEIDRKRNEAAAARRARLGDVADLPLLEEPATAPELDAFAVDLTGSGGYENLDVEVAEAMAAQGVPLVAISSPEYFWTNRDPEGMSRDLARILEHYLKAWHKSKAILIGYSQGADIMPFMINRLPPALRSKVASIGLIGPDDQAELDMGLAGFMTHRKAPAPLPVAPETERLKGFKVVCVYGMREKKPLCPKLDPKLGVDLFGVGGGHGFRGRGTQMAARFLTAAGLPVRPQRL